MPSEKKCGECKHAKHAVAEPAFVRCEYLLTAKVPRWARTTLCYVAVTDGEDCPCFQPKSDNRTEGE